MAFVTKLRRGTCVRSLIPIVSLTPVDATTYRASGLVLWPKQSFSRGIRVTTPVR
jgi:hypothetical protein